MGQVERRPADLAAAMSQAPSHFPDHGLDRVMLEKSRQILKWNGSWCGKPLGFGWSYTAANSFLAARVEHGAARACALVSAPNAIAHSDPTPISGDRADAQPLGQRDAPLAAGETTPGLRPLQAIQARFSPACLGQQAQGPAVAAAQPWELGCSCSKLPITRSPSSSATEPRRLEVSIARMRTARVYHKTP